MLAGQGETKQASISDFLIDKDPPSVPTVTFTRKNGAAYTPTTWSTDSITVHVTAADKGSSVNYYQASNDGGKTIYTFSDGSTNFYGEFTWTGDFNINECYRAIDWVGNVSNWTQSYNLKQDTTPPGLGYSLTNQTGWVNTLPAVSLSGSDPTSGISTYQYSASSAGPWTNCGAGGATITDGSYYRYYRCINGAGLASSVYGHHIQLDRVGPTMTGISLAKRSTDRK